jgi:hypothetical protein
MASQEVLALVDHLVYATADLDRGTGEVERVLGVRARPGGQHPNVHVASGNQHLPLIGRS